VLPDKTAAEVLALYPGAEVQPLPDRESSRAATPDERVELERLIAAIVIDPIEQAEAFAIAMKDVDSALVCYRSIVSA
jgi:hypothetical protein